SPAASSTASSKASATPASPSSPRQSEAPPGKLTTFADARGLSGARSAPGPGSRRQESPSEGEEEPAAAGAERVREIRRAVERASARAARRFAAGADHPSPRSDVWSGKRGSNPRHPPWQEGVHLRDVSGCLRMKGLGSVLKHPEVSASIL